jgi:hypothetical protein
MTHRFLWLSLLTRAAIKKLVKRLRRIDQIGQSIESICLIDIVYFNKTRAARFPGKMPG